MSDAVSRPDDGGRFISLWELFAQIGKAEAIYAYEAAHDLALCLSDDPAGLNYIRRRDELGILCPLDLDDRLRLLRLLTIFGSQGTLFDDDRPNDEAQLTFERFGFYASDIYPFLARHDLAISRPGDEGSVSRFFHDGRPIPGWVLTYDGQAWISYGRAVGILTASTVAAERHSPEHDDILNRWSKALSEAIERRAIGETTVSGKKMLAHADVRTWFEQQGHVWPLDAPDAPTPNVPGPTPSPEAQAPNINLALAGLSEHASKLGPKRQQQIAIIMEVADYLGYQRLQIPDHGKQNIHKECNSRAPHKFTESAETFDSIWKDAVKVNAVKMAKHNIYGRRG